MVEPGEFGDRDDIHLTLLVLVLLIPLIGIILLYDAINHQLSYGYDSSAEAVLGLLLVVIGSFILMFAIRWVRKVRKS
jgi:hypothetical protein